MSENNNNEKKLKATFLTPSTSKGCVIVVLALLTFTLNLWPIGIPLFNRNVLVMGLPLIVFWGLALTVALIIILFLARKWEVH